MNNLQAIQHLEELRKDVRDEIKQRIAQRDKYSIQLTISLASIVAVSFSHVGLGKVLIVAPLVSIYFTALIQFSYSVHKVLAYYLRKGIEPALSSLCGTPLELEWETFYKKLLVPGIRRNFFMIMFWVICAASLVYLWITQSGEASFRAVLWVVTIIYILAIIVITLIPILLKRKIREE